MSGRLRISFVSAIEADWRKHTVGWFRRSRERDPQGDTLISEAIGARYIPIEYPIEQEAP